MKNKNLLFKLLLSLLLVLPFDMGYSQTCPSNMISYWRLQEASSYSYSDEMDDHNAFAGTSAPVQTSGISGKAQLFDGNSYLSVPGHTAFNWAANGSFALELWVRFSEIGAVQVMVGRDDPSTDTHWYIAALTTGRIEFYTKASDGSSGVVTTSTAYNNGQWHHIVAQRDGTTAKNYLYIDGILQNAGGTTVTLSAGLASTANITIGNMVYNDSPMFFFNGSIDEVAFYSRILTPTEITDHYNNIRLYQIGYCDGNGPVLFSTPAIHATVGQQYNYDVDASGNPVPTYTLLQKPTGMTINAAGLISWTPSSISESGHVVVKIENTSGSVQQSYDIFVSDPPVCRNDLVAYWGFDQTAGSPYYDNMNAYPLTGNPTPTSGIVGKGVAFNGVSDSMTMADNAEPEPIFFDLGDPYGTPDMSSFSIELWMKSSASWTGSNPMVMVGRDQPGPANLTHYWVGVKDNGTVQFYLIDWNTGTTATVTGGSVLDGAWHHIVATFEAGDVITLWVDKIKVDEVTANLTYFGGDADLCVGHLNMSPSFFWYDGLLDELAFYNVSLTEAQVINNYNNAIAGDGACSYNYAPLITSSPVTSVNQGSLYSYTFVATDATEDDISAITAVTKPDWLTFTYNASDTFAILSGTPGNSNVGPNNITLRVSDGLVDVDQTFQVNVVNVNDAPSFTSSPVVTVNEDSEYSYTPEVSDIDAGTVLTYSASLIPDWMTFDAATHTLTGTPENDQVGLWDVVLSVTDGTASVDQDFQVTVSNVNDLPVITSVPEDTIQATNDYMYEFVATDVDEGDVLTFSAETKPSWLTFTNGTNSGILTGVPENDDAGTHAVILKVSDGHGEALQAFTIVVTPFVGIREIDNSIVHSVYPNPATEKVYFRLSKYGKSRIEIYDITGNLYKQADSYNEDLVEISISDLSNGFYLYKVYQDGKVAVGKITKE